MHVGGALVEDALCLNGRREWMCSVAVLITHRGLEGANPCYEQQEGNSASQKRTLSASVSCLRRVYLVLRNQVLLAEFILASEQWHSVPSNQ